MTKLGAGVVVPSARISGTLERLYLSWSCANPTDPRLCCSSRPCLRVSVGGPVANCLGFSLDRANRVRADAPSSRPEPDSYGAVLVELGGTIWAINLDINDASGDSTRVSLAF